MRKTLIFSLAFIFVFSSVFMFVGTNKASAKAKPKAGSIIKGKSYSTLYYLGEDGKRYVFPNSNTYFSWFDNFEGVEEIDDEELFGYMLGGNVRYKPGVVLVKIQTDPKVYAVGENGKLRWIKTEKVARALYGANWNKMVDDVPDSFFTNYETGDPIENEDDFDPDEESEEIPTIGHNRGFKARLQIARVQNAQERKCDRLENVLRRAQRRFARLGIEVSELGQDYLDECFDTADNILKAKNRMRWFKNKKVTICHIPQGDPENAQTISVSKAAARAHLAHGDTMGACDDTGSEDIGEEPDETAPVISDVSADPADVSAVITWTTDEAADSKVTYADESLASASTTTEVTDDTIDTSHKIEITGLATSTEYFFMVESSDASNNVAASGEDSFTTGL